MAHPETPILTPYDIFLFAGESSGDLHGESLIEQLLALRPNLSLYGVGGPRMRAAGLSCLMPMENFQVMGFFPVFLALPKILVSFYRIARHILKAKPKVVLCIDYPGFTLRLERYLKKKGFQGKIVHYICPSVWAWGKGRIPLMEKTLDLLLSIFPFEKEHFSPSFPISYVNRISSYHYHPFPVEPNKKLITLFPGSRQKEIELNLPLQLKALDILLNKDPNLVAAISISHPKFQHLINDYIYDIAPTLSGRIFPVFAEQTYNLMASTSLALAKSGTVTLELALHKVPTVVVYAIPSIDLFIAKDLLRIRLSFYCIVNIIGKKEIYVELIGPNATEENLLKAAQDLLYTDKRLKQIKQCEELIEKLGTTNASQTAAHLLIDRFL
jgi:lipid-A-disaccharide synthase